MKSPCHDCDLLDEDKNGDECRLCEARAEYAEGVETGYSLKVVRLKEKKGGIMAKRGTCGNCERGDLLLPAFGLCWVCYEARKDAEKAGEPVADALAEIRERVKAGKGLRGKLKKGKNVKGEAGIVKREAESEPRTTNDASRTTNHEPEPFGMIYLEFKDDVDKGLFEWLVDYSAKYRRSVDQQILWILQHYVQVGESERGEAR